MPRVYNLLISLRFTNLVVRGIKKKRAKTPMSDILAVYETLTDEQRGALLDFAVSLSKKLKSKKDYTCIFVQ